MTIDVHWWQEFLDSPLGDDLRVWDKAFKAKYPGVLTGHTFLFQGKQTQIPQAFLDALEEEPDA